MFVYILDQHVLPKGTFLYILGQHVLLGCMFVYILGQLVLPEGMSVCHILGQQTNPIYQQL